MGRYEAPTVSHHKKADFFMGVFFFMDEIAVFLLGSTSPFRLDFHFLPFPGGVSFNSRNNVGLFLSLLPTNPSLWVSRFICGSFIFLGVLERKNSRKMGQEKKDRRKKKPRKKG